MRTLLPLLLLVTLSGCIADNHQHNSGSGPNANGTVAVAVGKQDITPQVGLENTTNHTEAGANSVINDPAIIEGAYRSMVIMVLAFSGVMCVGFSGLVIVLVRGHQRHVKELFEKRIQ